MYQFIPAPTSLKIRKTTNFFLLLIGIVWLVTWVASFLILVILPLETEFRPVIIVVLLMDIMALPAILWYLSRQKPVMYELDGKKLTVKRNRPYQDIEMDLSQVTRMEARKNYASGGPSGGRKGGIRVYAMTGTVWNAELGGQLSLALTNEEDYIVLSGDKFGYAVSPADMDGFMRAVQQELHI